MIADRDDATQGGPATDDAFEWTESRYGHPRGAGAGKAVAGGWICAEVRVVGVADTILSAHRPLFFVGAVAEQRSVVLLVQCELLQFVYCFH